MQKVEILPINNEVEIEWAKQQIEVLLNVYFLNFNAES